MKVDLRIVLAIVAFFVVLILVLPWLILEWSWVEMSNSASSLPSCSVGAESDAELCKVEYNMLIKQIRGDYQAWSMENRATALLWQQASTIATFVLVSGVIFAGVGLAIFEFIKGSSGNTTLKFGSDGVEVSSEIIGIIILTLSLGFAYIYIDRLYPISEIGRVEEPEDKRAETSK
ncbi:hypothetical protein [Parasedimentitalea huanghaiensis]|uniref:Uncharacterized protein n=1 Tax=Parasedimentitalea huanghaiensis TaxID=2682100 RepID=A0A6L6WHZ1_9RHOB|nr:hypothetical protein [Zongyanglinia huanghaiensis]MVO16215.1 hypothetical protein [Zongyanglinia huanghaiensis]